MHLVNAGKGPIAHANNFSMAKMQVACEKYQ